MVETEEEKRVTVLLVVGKKIWGRWQFKLEGGLMEPNWLCGTIIKLGGKRSRYKRMINWEDGTNCAWEMSVTHAHGSEWLLEDEKSLIPSEERIGLQPNRCVPAAAAAAAAAVVIVVQLLVLGQALVHGREGTEVMRNNAIGCYLHLLAFLSALTAAMMATTKGEPNLCQKNGKRLPHRSAPCNRRSRRSSKIPGFRSNRW
jgi:hypothetical protein